MNEKRYTIEDLCELTGFPRRTIRYYIQEGLLEPPAGRGRGGFYFDSHLQKLLEIKALQERGVKLAAIARVLSEKTEEHMWTAPEVTCEREVWVKHPIADGIELHFSRELEKREAKRIAEIIRVARSILDSGGAKDE